MKKAIRDFFRGAVAVDDQSYQAYQEAARNLEKAREGIIAMRKAFMGGGLITYEELKQFEVSTAENPILYPTGQNCTAFRVASPNKNELHFFCHFNPKDGLPARYGYHAHPDCIEHTLQLTGTAEANGQRMLPLSCATYNPLVYHDYIMHEPGTIYVIFQKVKNA